MFKEYNLAHFNMSEITTVKRNNTSVTSKVFLLLLCSLFLLACPPTPHRR